MSLYLDKIIPILAEYSSLSADEITPEDNLDALDIDSLSLVEIIFDLEELFDIKVPDEAELNSMGLSMTNVKSIAVLVEQLLNEQAK